MDPVTAVVVGAEVISKVAGAISTVKSLFGKKPKPSDPVAVLKPYVVAILNHLAAIEQQNREIIKRLDKLPEIFRDILKKELNVSALDGHYSNLKSKYLALSAMDDQNGWELSTDGWLSIGQSITFLYDFEYRLSKIPEVVLWTFFADYASGGKVRSIFRALIGTKLVHLGVSRAEVQTNFDLQVKSLRVLLSTEYVALSNIDQITRLEDLQYTMQADRTKVIQVSRQVTEQYFEGDCCRAKTRIKVIIEDKTVPDDVFNNGRDGTRLAIQTNLPAAIQIGQDLTEICAAQQLLQWTLDELSEKGFVNEALITVTASDDEAKALGFVSHPAFLEKATNCYGH